MPTKHISINDEEQEVLTTRQISPTALFKSAIRQLQSREMFFDPEAEYDHTYLFNQILKYRKIIEHHSKIISQMGEEKQNLEGEVRRLSDALGLTPPQPL